MSEETSRLEPALKAFASRFEQTLTALLPQGSGPESRVTEAMRYAVLGGGKRLRPFLVFQSGLVCGASEAGLLTAGAAVECVHVYSLIHDDLPAMDNDDLRRGKPTVHKAFDEATAILAGDALLTFAFEILGREDVHPDPRVRCALVVQLARAIGTDGMIGGQMVDILYEGRFAVLEDVTRLQRMKSADLITFSCEAGAILAGAVEATRAALAGYGRQLGLAFQAADDLLDAEGDSALLGKAAQKDARKGKPTIVAALGIAGARQHAEALAKDAKGYLDSFGEKADLLRTLAAYVVQRRT